MGLFDIFKSSSKAVETASEVVSKSTDGIISGIDKMFHTEEEKADAKQKWFDTWLTLQDTLAHEGTPTAIARRVLAFMIMGMFLFLILFGVIVWKFSPEWSKVIFNAVESLSTLAAAVGATYFIKDAVVKAIGAKEK